MSKPRLVYSPRHEVSYGEHDFAPKLETAHTNGHADRCDLERLVEMGRRIDGGIGAAAEEAAVSGKSRAPCG